MSLSLRTRIALAVVILIAVVVVVTLAVAYHEMVEAMYYAIDQIVQRDVNVIQSEFLKNRTEESQTLSEIANILAGTDRIHSPLYRIWVEGEPNDLLAGRSESKIHPLQNLSIPERTSRNHHLIVTLQIGKQEYRAEAISFSLPNSSRIIHAAVAAPSNHALREIKEFRRFMLIFGGVVIVAAGGVAALLVRLAMRPVGVLASRLHKITHQNMSDLPLNDAAIPSDLRPFAESVDTMLGRLSQAFERQKRFTADAAHELRSPLAVAKSTLQSTLSLPECERDYLEMATSELEDLSRMENLIGQLLMLSRLEDETATVAEPIELASLLSESANLFSQPSRDVSVVLNEPIPSVTIAGRRDELLRLLSNLIDNAVRHGPAGGTVTLSAKRDANRQVRITVHDEGGNIPAAAIPHLTERFYRVDASRTRSTGGTGLGLAIAAEIVKQHAGVMDIQSSPQAGTTVTITFPIS